jgi:hypothetical protein
MAASKNSTPKDLAGTVGGITREYGGRIDRENLFFPAGTGMGAREIGTRVLYLHDDQKAPISLEIGQAAGLTRFAGRMKKTGEQVYWVAEAYPGSGNEPPLIETGWLLRSIAGDFVGVTQSGKQTYPDLSPSGSNQGQGIINIMMSRIWDAWTSDTTEMSSVPIGAFVVTPTPLTGVQN